MLRFSQRLFRIGGKLVTGRGNLMPAPAWTIAPRRRAYGGLQLANLPIFARVSGCSQVGHVIRLTVHS